MIKLQLHVNFNFSKASEEIEPSEKNLSQSGSGERTADEKSNGKISKFSEKIEPSEENLSQSGSNQRTEDQKSNGNVSNF